MLAKSECLFRKVDNRPSPTPHFLVAVLLDKAAADFQRFSPLRTTSHPRNCSFRKKLIWTADQIFNSLVWDL